MNQSSHQIYLQYLSLIREPAGYCTLSANERVILEAVTLSWDAGAPMSVLQVTSLAHLGSPATLHRRLAVLRESGYLEEISLRENKRTKHLRPTQVAMDYFEKLGRAMHAASSTKPAAKFS